MRFLILFFFTFAINSAFSQNEGTFRGYISSGFNINQIDGDSVTGFNYWGYTGGVGSYFMLTNNVSANLEINYSMRGGSGEQFNEALAYMGHQTYHTNYIELPVLFNYHDHKIARFGAGIVVSSLISSAQWYNYSRLPESNSRVVNYKSIDLGFIASASFDIKKHFGANIRMIHSLIPANKSQVGVDNQYLITLSARGIYYF